MGRCRLLASIYELRHVGDTCRTRQIFKLEERYASDYFGQLYEWAEALDLPESVLDSGVIITSLVILCHNGHNASGIHRKRTDADDTLVPLLYSQHATNHLIVAEDWLTWMS